VPFGDPEVAVLFRPSLVLGPTSQEADKRAQAQTGRRSARAIQERTIGAADAAGRFVSVTALGSVADELAVLGQAPGTFALFGLARAGADGLTFRCLSVVVSAASPAWPGGRGRIVPEAW
jgi:hypothetical protein